MSRNPEIEAIHEARYHLQSCDGLDCRALGESCRLMCRSASFPVAPSAFRAAVVCPPSSVLRRCP